MFKFCFRTSCKVNLIKNQGLEAQKLNFITLILFSWRLDFSS